MPKTKLEDAPGYASSPALDCQQPGPPLQAVTPGQAETLNTTNIFANPLGDAGEPRETAIIGPGFRIRPIQFK